MVTMADDTEKTAAGAVASFEGTADFLEWDIAGTVIGVNCGTVEELKKQTIRNRLMNWAGPSKS